MNIFKKPVPRPSILVEVNIATNQVIVKGCIDDTITALHMLNDAIGIVLKRFDARTQMEAAGRANGNGEGHA